MLILIFALSLSADALGAGLSFGLGNIKIPAPSKAVIGALSMCCAYLSLFFGNRLAGFMAPKTEILLGSVILAGMALWIIFFRVIKKKKTQDETGKIEEEAMSVLRNPEKGDMDHSGAIGLKEAFILGIALSVDMLSAGTALVLSGGANLYFPPIAGATQILLLILGERAGKHAFRFLISLDDRIISLASAIILLAVAAIRLMQR